MTSTVDPETVDWINEKVAKLHESGRFEGSAREDHMLAVWKRDRPEMYQRLGHWAPKLAFVLDELRYESMKQYLKAGWSPTDAEEQATREWCLLGPEAIEEERNLTAEELQAFTGYIG